MADRFPSLEDFSEGQAESEGNGNLNIHGSGADDDFLTRERALLGDDAAQFASANDNAATVEDGEGDLLGGSHEGTYSSGQHGGEEVTEFESSFPAIDTSNNHMAPGGTITGSGEPYLPGQPQSTYSSYSAQEEEAEPIRQWRERRDHDLSHRAEVSASKKAETIKAAQTAIDDFYENYNKKKDKSIAQARKEAEEFLASREDTSAGGTSWERIAKLVDLSGKGTRGGASGTGKERFRELLTSLRKDEKSPGAMGY
ncbi:MAG: clathrin light chain [Lasallia pustulata]|uniref:Clathrin light chain n=1 Tax=Lasallia pustulata TaxID=136370 RepID=A0A5M8PQ98_9LECA|nr:MAG: clathrin light chain [Lasallia pustulata]